MGERPSKSTLCNFVARGWTDALIRLKVRAALSRLQRIMVSQQQQQLALFYWLIDRPTEREHVKRA